MGIVAIDQHHDLQLISGSFGNTINPPAIYSSPSTALDPIAIIEKFGLYQGSGGEFSSLLPTSPSGSSTRVEFEQSDGLKSSIREICLAFKLTKEELAGVLKVQSRKTLYNWINEDVVPRKADMKRVFDLLVVARAWRDSGFEFSKERLHEPVLDDHSIFDLLNQSKIEKEQLLFAGSRLQMTDQITRTFSNPFA